MAIPITAAGIPAAVTAHGVGEYLKKRAETRSEAERDSHASLPRVNAATAGALEQAHALIAAVLRTIRDVDATAERTYDGLKASGDRLAGEFGGGGDVPDELRSAMGHNMSARRLLERAHRALDGAAAELARFDTRTLQV